MNDFGKIVKLYLIQNNLTQVKLADKMEISRGTLAAALNRDNVSIKQMQAIAEALNCDLKIELIPKEGANQP